MSNGMLNGLVQHASPFSGKDIAMKELTNIRISAIVVDERVRKDLGDLTELTASIRNGGMVVPIAVMKRDDDRFLLLCGERRLRVAQSLEWESIEAIIYEPMEADEALNLEFHENQGRKDWTDAEKVAWGLKYEEINNAILRERSNANLRHGDKSPECDPGHTRRVGRISDVIAKSVGYKSGRQYSRAKEVVTKRPDLAQEVEEKRTTITAAYRRIRKEEGRPLKEHSHKRHSKPAQQCLPPEQADHEPVVTDAPVVASMLKPSPEEVKADLKRLKETFVDVEQIELQRPPLYTPQYESPSGDDTIKGAGHEQLLMSPVYKKLFNAYQSMIDYSGDLRTFCEGKLQTLRSHRQVHRDMEDRIERLTSEVAELNARLAAYEKADTSKVIETEASE
jgi:ParB family chromosome partitioning protein